MRMRNGSSFCLGISPGTVCALACVYPFVSTNEMLRGKNQECLLLSSFLFNYDYYLVKSAQYSPSWIFKHDFPPPTHTLEYEE